MSTESVGMWLSIVGGAVTLGTVLVKLGRVLERQDVQNGQLIKHDTRLDDLEDGHGSHNATFESLRGEIKGLRGVMEGIGATMERMITKLDRHLENQGN